MDNPGYKILVTIPGYQIERELGHGGMSTVYLAVQESLQRRLALKVMSPALSHDPSFMDRFLREGQIIAQLSHPNIITIYDIGVVANRYFIAMEYVAGPTLTDRIAQGLTVTESLYIVKRVAKALDYAHRRGFIHRDIKPSNILFREDGEPVLADFGIAKAVEGDAKLTQTGFIPGTPSYMSPEQIRGLALDGRSDFYSLGVVLFQMLVGEIPYRGESSMSLALMHLMQPIPKLPPPLAFLQPVIEGMLAKIPEDRFENEQAFRRSLNKAIATSQHPDILEEPTRGYEEDGPPPSTGYSKQGANGSQDSVQARHRWRFEFPRKSWHWVAGIVVVALAAGGTLFLLSEPGLDPRTQRAVDRLLIIAEQQLTQGQLTAPEKYNAYDTYREILAIAPGYPPALQGLDQIGLHFVQRAQHERQAGQLDKALALVAQGLDVAPKHEKLLALQQEVSQAIQEAERQQRVIELLAEAERHLAELRLTTPKGGNALESYRAALDLIPDHSQAQQGLQRIADRLLELARSRQAEGDLTASLSYVREGLAAEPQHPGFIALEETLTEQIAANKRRERIARWHEAAQQQLAEGQLVEPSGQNAYETYHKILEADANDERAQTGLNAVAAELLALAESAAQANRFEESLVRLERAIELFPDHAAIKALRDTVFKKQAIQALLAKAKRQIVDSRYVEPKGDNALESYQAVLALEPQNATAQQGVGVIAARHLQRARRAERAGRLDDALRAAQQGLRAAPDHPELASLRAKLKQAIDERRARERTVVALLETANEHLAAGRYTAPAANNAYESYRGVLRLAPQHEEALRGLEKIVRALKEQALAKRRAGDLPASLGLIEQGLRVDPAEPALRALREKVLKQQAEEQKQTQIATLLERADDQRRAGKWVEPEGDNAQESYQAVLALEPDHVTALSGIRSVVEHFLELAQERQREGRLEDSLALIQRGQQMAPDEPELVALAKAVRGALDLQRRQARQIQSLLDNAAQQLAASRLNTPAGDNALDSYRQVLALDPQNQAARGGIGRIAERFLQRAEDQRARGDLDASARAVQAGLSIRPEHAELLKLQKTLETERLERQVSVLLAKAEQQLADDRLTAPEGDNALASFQQVLTLAPNHSQARQGIHRIATRLGERARARWSEGKLEEALALVDQALTLAPGEPALQSLHETLRQARVDERRTAEEVAALLELAAKQLAEGRLVEPTDDNAHASFQQILKLDPGNRQAAEGIEQIRDRVLNLAQEKVKAKDLEASLRLIDQGLAVAPNDSRLLRLRAQVETALEEKMHLTEAVERYLARAEEQRVSLRLTTPPGDNAHESYRQVLALDPTNARALSGIQHLVARLGELAQDKLTEGAPRDALALIEDGLSIVPEDARLQTLKRQTDTMLQRVQRVARLLETGEAQLARAQFVAPPGDSALESFRAALAIDPENTQAQAGLRRIVKHYRKRAEDERRQGNLASSLVFIGKGLGVSPQDPDLRSLEAELQGDLAAQNQREQSIKQLLASAEAQLARNQWTEPISENALESYQELLALDPTNAQALAGLERIARHFADRAEQEQARNAFDQSLVSIEQGLRAMPDAARLQTLKAEVSEQLTKAKRRGEDVAYWLAKAEEQLENVQLLEPPGDNAYQSFQQVIKIDPENPRALEGIKHIVEQHIQLAEAMRRVGELAGSLIIIEKGLSIAPDQPVLLALRKETERQLEQQRQQAEAVPRLLAQAEAKAQAGAVSDSLALIQEALSIAPHDSALHAFKANLEQKRTEEERGQTIRRLLTAAEEHLARHQWTEPKGENALESYQDVLALEPTNAQALAGLKRIAEHFADRAEQEQARGDFEQSLALTEQGLQAVPDHVRLQTLRADVSQQLAKARQRTQQIESLLTRAGLLLENDRLIDPDGDNAFQLFQQVLELDAENKTARQGIARITERHIELAEAKCQAGALAESLTIIEKGLFVAPDDPNLLAMREQVQGQRDQRARRQQLTSVLAQAEAKVEAGAFVESLALIQQGLAIDAQDARLRALKAEAERSLRDEEPGREIAQLFARAEEQLASGRLRLPKDDNAFASFEAILALDPENKRAIEGVQRIAHRYAELAQARWKANDVEGARTMLARGLEVDPTHTELLALRERFQQADAAQQRRDQALASLLAEAERKLASETWFEPTGENAYNLYQRALALDAQNQRARAGLAEIANRYEQLARRRSRTGDLQGALAMVERGLGVIPSHTGLRALEDAIKEAAEARQRGQDEMEQLLARAEQQVAAGKWTEPLGDNAFESFRAVQEIDSSNERAKEGLRQIEERYTQLARNQQQAGNLEEGLALVREALSRFPTSTDLIRARAGLNQAIAERQKKVGEKEPPATELERRLRPFGTF